MIRARPPRGLFVTLFRLPQLLPSSRFTHICFQRSLRDRHRLPRPVRPTRRPRRPRAKLPCRRRPAVLRRGWVLHDSVEPDRRHLPGRPRGITLTERERACRLVKGPPSFSWLQYAGLVPERGMRRRLGLGELATLRPAPSQLRSWAVAGNEMCGGAQVCEIQGAGSIPGRLGRPQTRLRRTQRDSARGPEAAETARAMAGTTNRRPVALA